MTDGQLADPRREPPLSVLRREPPPDFAERLRARLDAQVPVPTVDRARWPMARMAAAIAIVATTGALLAVPAVRASAQSLLARFRVVNFVALEVDEGRIAELGSKQVDLPEWFGQHVQVLQEPTPPMPSVSAEQAGAFAGITAKTPTWLPPDTVLKTIAVSGPGLVRLRADTARLAGLMDLLGIDDLEVPAGLDGKTADVRVPSVVRMHYEVQCEHCARVDFLQARAPEITLPDGVDLQALGEIGLRIFGLSADEARQFARSIDWRSTALVPVPWGATSFKHVDINGHQGIAVERKIEVENGPDRPGAVAIVTGRGGTVGSIRYERVLLWSDGRQVYGFEGDFRLESMLRMAYSLQ